MARLFLLPAVPASVAQARRRTIAEAVNAALAADHLTTHLDRGLIALAVSEPISNALRHGTSPVVHGLRGKPRVLVRMAAVEAGIEITVTDSGTGGKPHASPMPNAQAESGRGLALVQELTGNPVRAEQLASGKGQVTALVPWRRG